MSKDLFEHDFNEIVEFDDSLDVNKILEQSPDELDGQDPAEPDDDEEKNKTDEPDISSVNKILEQSQEDEDEDSDKDEDVDEDIDDDSPDPDDTKTSSSDAPFTVIFARDMMDQGLISSFDEEVFKKSIEVDGEAEALRNLIRNEINTNIETAKADMEEGYKQYLNLVEGGIDSETALNLTVLGERLGQIEISELDKEENSDLRKDILKNYFQMTTQFDDNKIEKLVQRSFDLGDDIEESKEYLEGMKKIVSDRIAQEEQEAARQSQLREQERQRQLETLKDTINSMSEIIPGQRINKQTKDKMYGHITKPITDKSGRTTNALWAKRAEDPLTFDAKLAYLYETGFFEKDKTWDKVKNVKVSKEASELERHLSSKSNTSKTGMPPTLGSKGSRDIQEIIRSTGSILRK